MRAEDVDPVRLRARQLLARLFATRPPDLESLRPQPDDYARCFVEDVVAPVRAAYEALWAHVIEVRVRPEQTELRIAVASVEELREGIEGARAFPGGYRDASVFFLSGPLWLAWDLRAPGADAGMAFDGLVPLDDRWAWFPKPWRHMPGGRPRAVAHWTE